MDTLHTLSPQQPFEAIWQDFVASHDAHTVKLAKIAAFPHRITAELLYCLRENFVPQVPWYRVGDILLSPLFIRGSVELYAMEMPLREILLKALFEDASDPLIGRLEQFMVDYIQHRVRQDGHDRANVFGTQFRWLPLACLRPGQALETIKAELMKLAQADMDAGNNPKDRFRLASLVESLAALPAMRDYQSILVRWSQLTRQGDDIQPFEEDNVLSSFPLQVLNFFETRLVAASHQSDPPTGLKVFQFQSVRVDATGKIVDRPRCDGFFYEESLADGVDALRMIAIRSGRFLMGSPDTESKRQQGESPQHWVDVPPFFMSQTPITQAQWRFIAQQPKVDIELETDPRFEGDRLPIERVSWFEAVEFCQRLSAYTRREQYRLPTEAEWEYACRAGSTTPFAFGETLTEAVANYNAKYIYAKGPKGRYRQRTTEVGSFDPNAFGLCDMHGNVYEWCQDHWHRDYQGAPDDGSAWVTGGDSELRILRGGSWDNNPANCRSARRDIRYPRNRLNYLGFRVVCALPRTSLPSAL